MDSTYVERIYFLNGEFSGSREWFANVGMMISKLPNLAWLTFDGLNIHASELERFWGEIYMEWQNGGMAEWRNGWMAIEWRNG